MQIKASLNVSIMERTLNGPFRDWISLGSLEYRYRYNSIEWAIIWGPMKAGDTGEWSICGGGRLESFYCSITDSLCENMNYAICE